MPSLRAAASAAVFFALGISPCAAFEIDFRWPSRDLCFGSAEQVDSPAFDLDDVPEGTRFISFELVDMDSGTSHGGGVVEWDGQDKVNRGAFSFLAPCLADARHTYEWTATAQERKQGGTLDAATARRSYPD